MIDMTDAPRQRVRIQTPETSAVRRDEQPQAAPRETVFEVPRQDASSGALSGRQRRQGRKPAACAATADEKKRQFSIRGVRAGQIGRQ